MTISKVKGKYKVDVSFGVDPITGKRIRKKLYGIDTLAKAKIIESELRQTDTTKLMKDRNTITFEQLAELFFEQTKHEHKPSYNYSKQANFKSHLLPYFKNADVRNISRSHIREFREELIDNSNLSYNTINKIILLLKKIFDVAVDEEIIDTNPCFKIKNLRIEKKEMEFWTPDEFSQFLDYLKEENSKENCFELIFYTLFFTGMRIGELLALTWNDIDFNRREIIINKNVSQIKGQTVVSTPKTKSSIRRISIHSKLANMLKFWKKEQEVLFINKFDLPHGNTTQVFQFKLMETTRFHVRKKMDVIYRHHPDLKKIRIHDFRHSHVALLIDNREELVTIKERMGHSSITTTIDVYGHLFPNRQQEMADRLNDLL